MTMILLSNMSDENVAYKQQKEQPRPQADCRRLLVL